LAFFNFELPDNTAITKLQNSKLSSLSRPKASRIFIGASDQKIKQTLGTSRNSLSDPIEEKFAASSTRDFAYLLLNSGLPRKPSWFKGSFSYKQRKLDWQISAARPVFYELDSTMSTPYLKPLSASKLLASCSHKRHAQRIATFAHYPRVSYLSSTKFSPSAQTRNSYL